MRHIWIFQLAAEPDTITEARIQSRLDGLIDSWKAHGTPVPGQSEIRYSRFVIVQAEPGHASGCSIDSMQRGVTDILHALGHTAVGHDQVFYRAADGSIASIDFREARAAVADGRLHAGTIVFDATLGQSSDLDRWEVPLEQTWLARFLPQRA
jgi:hypothetical protein